MFGTLRRAAEGSEDGYAFIETAPHGGGGFVACRRCRARKVRCSGQRSGCDQCAALSERCTYRRSSSRASSPGPCGAPTTTASTDGVDSGVFDLDGQCEGAGAGGSSGSVPQAAADQEKAADQETAAEEDEVVAAAATEGNGSKQCSRGCLELLLRLLDQLQTAADTDWTVHGLLAAHRDGITASEGAFECARCTGCSDMVLLMSFVCDRLARMLERAVWMPCAASGPLWLGALQIATPQELQALDTALLGVQLQRLRTLVSGLQRAAPGLAGAPLAVLAAIDARLQGIALDLSLRQ